MNPEERQLLERSVKLSEENYQILRSMKRAMFWSSLWGFVRVLLFIVPLIIGYLYLEPYLGSFAKNITELKSLLNQ